MPLLTFWRIAKLTAERSGVSLRALLEDLAVKHFKTTVSDGRVLLSTAEAGGSVEFEVPSGMGPNEIARLADKALRHLETQTDQTNPNPPREITRLRATFNRASIS